MRILPKKAIPTDSGAYVVPNSNKFPLCRAAPPQCKGPIYKICIRQSYDRGETIIDSYRGQGYIYIVLKGSVFLYQVSPETGRRRIFWVSQPGDLVGAAYFWGRPTNEELDDYAEAAEDTLLMALPRNELARIVEQQKELLVAFGDVLSRRLRYIENKLVESTLLPLEDRLLAEIVRLSKMRGQANLDGYHLDIRLTHDQLADLIGVTRPTLSKAISNLKRHGCLFTDEEGYLVVPSKRLGTTRSEA